MSFESDDFNSNTLDLRWRFVDPVGDGTHTLTGAGSEDAYLELFVPARTSHNPWRSSNNSVRAMQPATDEDFELEVKFASQPSQSYQMQGILVEEDADNWIRFDTYHDGSNLKLFAATTLNGNSQVKLNQVITPGTAAYLRVMRQGNTWILFYSSDGNSWTNAGNFNQELTVSAVGTFAANHAFSGSPPEFTAQVDYFFNTAAPIIPEDETTGSGTTNQPLIANDDSGPVIDVWYGSDQIFGNIGRPQNWVNVLGNVSDPDGVASLSYSFNDGPQIPLTIGTNSIETRRLISPGDFNIELAYSDLNGSSIDDRVQIFATDTLGNSSTTSVVIDYESSHVWPDHYLIDWNSVTNIRDVAQVVDGHWAIEGDSVRTIEPGYDRLISIGETSWENYEVQVPITINNLGQSNGRDGTGVGIMMRWTGHTDIPVSGWQPKSGWRPLGAIAWYRNNRLSITGTNGITNSTSNKTLQEGVTYNFKMRVETVSGIGNLYSLKTWEAGQPEPSSWDVQRQEDFSGPQSGSVVLIAHEHDASFGDFVINPLNDVNDMAILIGSDINDVLIGVDLSHTNPGEGEIDTLTGRGGADNFILGDSTKVYYDDGNPNNSGLSDYVLITDFSIAQQDFISLYGSSTNYLLGASPQGLPSGTAIFQDSTENELIAIIQGNIPLELESSSFRFV